MATFFAGKNLKSKSGTVAADVALDGKEVIAVYFSAHWCPPCRGFTPMLKDRYEEAVNSGYKLAIIFVSSDRDEDAMNSYYNDDHGDWFAVPFTDAKTVADLKASCNVSGIPKLVIIDKDGKPLNENARADVTGKDNDECYTDWKALYQEIITK